MSIAGREKGRNRKNGVGALRVTPPSEDADDGVEASERRMIDDSLVGASKLEHEPRTVVRAPLGSPVQKQQLKSLIAQ